MDLFAGWVRVCRAVGAGGDVAGAGARLISAYGTADRAYHDLRHLTEVLERIDELSELADGPDLVRLAAWFHDAVYDTSAVGAETGAGADSTSNEERSALLAAATLRALRVDETACDEVARLVRLTTDHTPEPGDVNGAVLCDADLAVLARDPHGYADYAAAVRLEYAHVPDEAFRAGRAAILRAILGQPLIFRTAVGRERWEAAARANITAELRHLEP